MNRVMMGFVLGGLTLGIAGCGGSPLVGRWNASNTGAQDLSATLVLGGDMKAGFDFVGSGSCNGTISIVGLTWSSTDTTITFSGTPACTGMITCTVNGMPNAVDCSGASGRMQNGACSYTLSNNNNTLTLSNCSGGLSASSFTRAN